MTPTGRTAALLLDLAHALDHLFLLIFATAVAAIATDFGFARWEDLMPYSVGASVMFGLGSLPAGKLCCSWGRRPMMLVFFFGLGASAVVASLMQTVWHLAAALSLMGKFAAIYHPVWHPDVGTGRQAAGRHHRPERFVGQYGQLGGAAHRLFGAGGGLAGGICGAGGGVCRAGLCLCAPGAGRGPAAVQACARRRRAAGQRYSWLGCCW